MFESIRRQWREARREEPREHHLSDEQVKALETIFCLHKETGDLLERAASDRTAYDEMEAVLRTSLQDEAFVSQSLLAADSLKRAMDREPTDAYYVARRGVETSRFLDASAGPRGCLETVLGRKIGGREWEGSQLRTERALFERAWNDQSPFASPTVEWVKGQTNRQYLIFLRRQYGGG